MERESAGQREGQRVAHVESKRNRMPSRMETRRACFRIRNKARSCRKEKNPYYIEKAVSHRNDGKPLEKPASGVATSVRPNRSFKNRRASKRRILIIWKSEEAAAASGEGDKMERPRPIPAAGLTITFGKCRGGCSYL